MEQKREASDRAVEAERQLKTIGVAIAKHRLDDVFTIVWGNEAFYQLIEYTEREFPYQELASYGNGNGCDFTEMMQTFHEAYRHGEKGKDAIIQMPKRHGEAIWVKASASFMEEESAVYVTYTDINDIMVKQEIIHHKEKQDQENIKWMLSEYNGNVYISDMDTYEMLYVNDHFCETLNMKPEQILGEKCYKAVQGRDQPCPFCTNSQLNETEVYEWEFFNPNLKRSFMIKNKMLEWEGRRARLELSHDMESAESQLAKKDREREAMLKMIPAGMVRIDARDYRCVLWYNDLFLEMLGYTKDQFEEELHNRCAYMHPDDFNRASEMARELKKTGDHVVFEARAYTRSKEERVWTVTLCYVSAEDSWDGIPSLYSIGLDITKERKQMEKLQHIAEKDALTGIYNRSEVEKQIKDYLESHPDHMAALFMIDTDNFKRINDTMGHMTGDMVLAEMASGMKKIMRDSDIVGRVGGDEFTIFMKDIQSVDDVEKKAKDLIQMFHRLFEKDKSAVSITCSMGVSLYPEDGSNFKDMFVKADQALYQAKSRGKNGYIRYDQDTFKDGLDAHYVSYRTEIESEKRYDGASDSVTRYAFRTLYQERDLDKAINSILEIVGKQYDVSRAYVFENSDDGRYTSNTYEWCNEGVQPEINQLQNCDYDHYGGYEHLFGKDHIFYCRDIHTLKPEQEALFAKQGIHSTLQCEFLDEGRFHGFVGFDECSGLRLWTQDEVSTLSMISQILSLFLQQKKMKKLNQEIQQYEAVLDNLEECICVIEKDHNLLLYANRQFQICCPEYQLNEKCVLDEAHFHRFPILWDQKEAKLCVERIPEIL